MSSSWKIVWVYLKIHSDTSLPILNPGCKHADHVKMIVTLCLFVEYFCVCVCVCSPQICKGVPESLPFLSQHGAQIKGLQVFP